MKTFDEELYLSAALREMIENRAYGDGGPGDWFALVQRLNGDLVGFVSATAVYPSVAQRVFAGDVLKRLNGEIGHGGKWAVFFTHPVPRSVIMLNAEVYGQWVMTWLDADGDPQFVITCDDRWDQVIKAGVDKWIEDAEDGWQAHVEMLRILDPQPHQQFMAARGEKRPTPTRH